MSDDGASLLSRRAFIRSATWLGVGAAAGTLTGISVQQLLTSHPGVAGPIHFSEPREGVPVHLSDLDGDPVKVITGEWDRFPAIVYKVKRAALAASSQIRGRNTMAFALDHPTEPEHMILAYDGKCTHLGCTVGWNSSLGASKDVDDYDGDGVPDGRILCPCHQAQFDIHDLGTHVPGTPAPKPLPVLRIKFGPGDDPEIWALERLRQERPGDALRA